jgi:hypothetical protein
MEGDTMPGNSHFWAAQHPDIEDSQALVEATLTLAFEQRTRTLVAYMVANPDALVTDAIDVTVRERLGLAPDPLKVRRDG